MGFHIYLVYQLRGFHLCSRCRHCSSSVGYEEPNSQHHPHPLANPSGKLGLGRGQQQWESREACKICSVLDTKCWRSVAITPGKSSTLKQTKTILELGREFLPSRSFWRSAIHSCNFLWCNTAIFTMLNVFWLEAVLLRCDKKTGKGLMRT